MSEKLKWVQGKFNIHHGSGGRTELFTISWKTRTSDPNYYMKSTLPGLSSSVWQSDDLNILKGRAEDILDDWLLKVVGVAREGY